MKLKVGKWLHCEKKQLFQLRVNKKISFCGENLFEYTVLVNDRV